ncbi:MAG: uracil-DNA glycosylase [Bacteroidetes bacterium]|nr:uracil-DNA glycosylase [Bacteroidota bacterium]
MGNENQPEKILKDVELFLKQQAELFGDETFLPAAVDDGDSRESTAVVGNSQQIQSKEIKGESHPENTEADLKQKPKTVRVTEDRGLFEGTVLNPEWKIDPHWYESDSLGTLDSRISGCKKCQLGTTRKNFVFGVGNPNSKLVLIGEAPGADEDEQGEPFVGRAGQLLNKILAAVQLRREDVYICNIIKCRPPNNRDPLPDEVEACEPFLKKQLEIIRPKLILCLGRIAGQTLLKTNVTLTEMRNNIYEYQGIKVMVTFHPAALLRNPNWKRPAWEDVQKMRKLYDEM